MQMNALCVAMLWAPNYVTAILEAEILKKWKSLNRYIAVTTNSDEKVVFF